MTTFILLTSLEVGTVLFYLVPTLLLPLHLSLQAFDCRWPVTRPSVSVTLFLSRQGSDWKPILVEKTLAGETVSSWRPSTHLYSSKLTNINPENLEQAWFRRWCNSLWCLYHHLGAFAIDGLR